MLNNEPLAARPGMFIFLALCRCAADLSALCSKLHVLYVTWLSFSESVFLIKFAPFLGNG